MNAAPALVRPELAADALAVRTVLAEAFGGTEEADLVEHLRRDDDLVESLVAETAVGVPIGYVGFPRLALDTPGGAVPVVGLAPLAVAPSRQRQGIGSALVQHGLARLRERGEPLIFVLGYPAYYGRFGFAPAPRFASPYAGPHFMALRLHADAPEAGTVSYPRAFAGLR
jgi:putative acetyltransferase